MCFISQNYNIPSLSTSCIKYILIGDDHQWNTNHFGRVPNVYIVRSEHQTNESAALDMCVLSRSTLPQMLSHFVGSFGKKTRQ
jgi:hypothetical protein